MPELVRSGAPRRPRHRRARPRGDRPLFLTVFFSAAHFPYASPRSLLPSVRLDPTTPGRTAIRSRRSRRRRRRTADRGADSRALRRRRRRHRSRRSRACSTRLQQDGLADDTIVVLLADHGENLYDLPERGMGHGDHLRGSASDHVPWVWSIRAIICQPHDVDGIVRDVDFAPTLAHLVGVTPPPTDGVDLAPLLARRAPDARARCVLRRPSCGSSATAPASSRTSVCPIQPSPA